MSDIYDQHTAAFAKVSAFTILKDGAFVATVALKFPKDGAGRLYAYVHWIGIEMVRGHAGGYGYDKRSAAVSSAAGKAIQTIKPDADDVNFARASFFRLCAVDDGRSWESRLEQAGFTVLQAV